jgi:hypothetical protein
LEPEVPRPHSCNSSNGLAGPPSPRRAPKLVTRQERVGMMVCNRSPASPRRFAPNDLTADVPAGLRPVRVSKVPGRAFACRRGLTVGHSGAIVELGKKAAGGPGLSGSQVIKRRAELHAAAFASTIQELRSAGFASRRALADELNRRGIPTARGGRWHYTTVVRMLMYLGMATSGNGMVNNGKANKQAADVRAEALRSTILELRTAGFLSNKAITRELNERGIATAKGGKWQPAGVSRVLHRLERLEPSSRTGLSPASDAEPK